MDSDGTQIVIFDYNIPVTENITVRMFSRQRLMCMLFTVYSLCYKDNFFFVFLYISACVDTLPLILSFCYQNSVETFVLFTLHITVYLKSAKLGISWSIRYRILRSRYLIAPRKISVTVRYISSEDPVYCNFTFNITMFIKFCTWSNLLAWSHFLLWQGRTGNNSLNLLLQLIYNWK